jgi:hypothetical protein
MTVTATQLRQNIYRLLDQVLESGVPLEVERNGQKLEIVPRPKRSKLDNIVPDPTALTCDPEEIVHMDWSHLWRPSI